MYPKQIVSFLVFVKITITLFSFCVHLFFIAVGYEAPL